MAKIPPLIYIGVGLLVVIISMFSFAKFFFFFVIGMIFVLVGLIRLLLNWANPQKENPSHKVYQNYKPVNQAQHYKRCKFCANAMRAQDYFCSRCGSRN